MEHCAAGFIGVEWGGGSGEGNKWEGGGVGWNLCSSAEMFRNEFSHLHLAVQARVLLYFLYSLSSLFPPSHCVPCLVELAASGGSW